MPPQMRALPTSSCRSLGRGEWRSPRPVRLGTVKSIWFVPRKRAITRPAPGRAAPERRCGFVSWRLSPWRLSFVASDARPGPFEVCFSRATAGKRREAAESASRLLLPLGPRALFAVERLTKAHFSGDQPTATLLRFENRTASAAPSSRSVAATAPVAPALQSNPLSSVWT
jgi:hypothetical protein